METDQADLDQALSKINEIHEHLAKTEHYQNRGIRSVPIALAGVLGLMAAAIQPTVIGAQPLGANFVIYWASVAGIGLVAAAVGVWYQYRQEESPQARCQMRMVVLQFVPCLVGGLVVTATVGAVEGLHAEILPGIWACFFSLGTFAARPYLPRIFGWIALFYLIAGAVLLSQVGQGNPLSRAFSPWGMGITFGVGQLLSALVLHLNVERKNHG